MEEFDFFDLDDKNILSLEEYIKSIVIFIPFEIRNSKEKEEEIGKRYFNFAEMFIEDLGFKEPTINKYRNLSLLSTSGWILSKHTLEYKRLSHGRYKLLKEFNPVVITEWDELEKWKESIKQRFSSKKFGL
jgi:hypothetical protein